MKWFDGSFYYENDIPFNFVIGPRGIGKTYSIIKYPVEHSVKIIYLRNSQKEIDISCSNKGNPFKKLNEDLGFKIEIKKSEDISLIREMESNLEIGYGIALSTFSNMRGIDFSDVEAIIFEEFNTRPIKKQFDLFFGLYETVNRNRELLGCKPVKCIFISNSSSLYNDILINLNLVNVIEKMVIKNKSYYISNDKLIRIDLINGDNEVSKAKQKTVAYLLAEKTNFYREAIENEFVHDDFSVVKYQNIIEYRPLASIDEKIYIYKHKNLNKYYISGIKSNCPNYNINRQFGLFYRNIGFNLYNQYMSNNVYFQNYTLKLQLLSILEKRR